MVRDLTYVRIFRKDGTLFPIEEETRLVQEFYMKLPKLRSQYDYDADQNSADTAYDATGSTLTRQEYKDDADINNIVRRFGVEAHARQPLFGEMNFDRGLQEAFAEIRQANHLWLTLPPELRDKYKSRAEMYAALDNGKFATDLEDALKSRNAPNLQEELTWLRTNLTALRSSLPDQAPASESAAAAGSAAIAATRERPPSTPTPTASKPSAA